MLPHFLWFGGKHRLAKHLGPPRRDLVIEAFAGSAGYSTYWEPKKVILIDCNPIICGIWRFLIKAKPREIMRMPSHIIDISELPQWVPQEARWLCGLWMNASLAEPAKRRSNWARQPKYASKYWSETIKTRIANQLDRIRHWKIIEGSYEEAPNAANIHFHIDPPYNTEAGKTYRHSNIDYTKLAAWCRARKGFVQVCESADSKWLDFQPYTILTTCHGMTVEAVWTNEV